MDIVRVTPQYDRIVRCLRDCGKTTESLLSSIRAGRTQSCGCLKRECDIAKCLTHGLTGTPEYEAWINMRQRCTNPKRPEFRNYGARGISVCERWESFENFLDDMGTRPMGLSIERINNDGNYEPSNCKWATKVEQCRNMRRSRIFPHNGESKTLTEWSKVLGINYDRLRGRLRLGWTFERAIE